MINLQTIVATLISLLFDGGAGAAKELFKGVMLNRAEAASKTWRELFAEKPESYSLVDRVVNNPQDSVAQQQLRTLLEEFLEQRPDLVNQLQQSITIGEVKAESGVAVGVMRNSNITINNR